MNLPSIPDFSAETAERFACRFSLPKRTLWERISNLQA